MLDQGGGSWRFYIKRQLNGGTKHIVAPETRVLTEIKRGKLAGVTRVSVAATTPTSRERTATRAPRKCFQ